MAGPSSAKTSPGDGQSAGGEGFAVSGTESWDQPVRLCPAWPPELALPPEPARPVQAQDGRLVS